MVERIYHDTALVRYRADATRRPTKTIIIVYEQPKVNVVRHYSKTFVPQVNPRDYEKQHGNVLLDTSTLLSLTRKLNIRDSFITPPKRR